MLINKTQRGTKEEIGPLRNIIQHNACTTFRNLLTLQLNSQQNITSARHGPCVAVAIHYEHSRFPNNNIPAGRESF